MPALHSKTPVNLETMRLEVKRDGQNALITGDNLRADVHAEFYIKVERDEESIIAAATSLGTKSMSPVAITELLPEDATPGPLRGAGRPSHREKVSRAPNSRCSRRYGCNT